MLNFMKTMVSAVKSWTEKKFDESTADWNQNDPTASNYIKNRTHWEEKREFTAVPETCIPKTHLYTEYLDLNWDIVPQIEPGVTYTITFNGVKYESVGKNDIGWGQTYIGNHPHQLHASSEYPFSIVYEPYDGLIGLHPPHYGQYTISISYLLDGVETVIAPEQTVYNFGRRSGSDFATTLVVGNVYKVTWDGIEYELTAINGTELDQEGYVFLGTLGDHPFEYNVDLDGNYGEITFLEDGIHTISIQDVLHDDLLLSTILNDLSNFYFQDVPSLQVGTRYTVTIGNETYTCVGRCDYEGPSDRIYIGNQFFFNDSYNYSTNRVDTGEPFLIYLFTDSSWDMYWLPSETRGAISVVADGTFIHKIDQKYIELPAYVATSEDIEAVASSKMDYNNPVGSGSFSMGRKSGTTTGYKSYARGINVQASGENSYADGYNTTASGNYSHAEGHYTTASGHYGSHAEGSNTAASGNYSHAEGYKTAANGSGSHAEGGQTTSSGDYTHAEGNYTTASGNYSHAEGYKTTTPAICSHAEGYYTTANGYASHAEGFQTTADGYASHAEGYYTTAKGNYQHAQGKYNIIDSNYAHIVGNGTSTSNRSNMHTLDWNGVGWYKGGLQVGGNAQDKAAKNVLLEGDAIPVPEIAAVGQTIVVKTVDKNGKPTEWETIDKPVYIANVRVDQDRYSFIDGSYETLLNAYSSGATIGLNVDSYMYYLHHIDGDNNLHFGQIPHRSIESDHSTPNYNLMIAPDNSFTQIRMDIATEQFVLSKMENILEPVQADWSQSDLAAPDYVKNRPFYSETISETASFRPAGSSGDSLRVLVSNEFIAEIFRRPDTVIVNANIDGSNTLQCPITIIDDTRVQIEVPENQWNVPYLYVTITSDLDGKYLTVKSGGMTWKACDITVSYEEIYVLDEKFIPDTIARINDIDEAASTDDEIIDVLIQEDMLFALTDSTGFILTDENNDILTW